MQKSKPLEYPAAYNQRDVLTLKPLNQWTQEEEMVHLEHNRILQSGFTTRAPEELIANAKLVGEDWLTDVACPRVEGALAIHLAKEMVVTYKVGEEDLDTKNQRAYKLLLEDNPDIQNQLEQQINSKLSIISPSAEELEASALSRLARNNENRKRNHLPELPITNESLDVAKSIDSDLIRKKVTYEIVDEYVQSQREHISAELALGVKDIVTPGQNSDYAFLGAAGSGKSTISREFLDDNQKENCVVVATDNYRAFTIPGSDERVKNVGQNRFTQTQDFAYMIKELVQKDIVERSNGRPDIIFDAVTLDYNTKKLLQHGNVTSAVAAYSGTGFVGIPERADFRARDENAAPADKARFVNTTSLLEGHANASDRLLTSVPDKAITKIYDTNVERGKPAVEIGAINTINNTLEIADLKSLSEFLNKRNLNIEAIHQVDLIYNPQSPLNLLSTHPENKAKAVLDLIPETRFKPAFTIKMMDKQGVEYAELTSAQGNVKLNISNFDVFDQKASSETIEGAVLRAITRQVEKGGLEASFNQAFEKGDKNAFKESMVKIKQDMLKAQKLKKLGIRKDVAEIQKSVSTFFENAGENPPGMQPVLKNQRGPGVNKGRDGR